jgi:hypothetical protein
MENACGTAFAAADSLPPRILFLGTPALSNAVGHNSKE